MGYVSPAQVNSFTFAPRLNLGYFFPTQTTVLSGERFMNPVNMTPLSVNKVILQSGRTKTVILQNGGYGFEFFYNRKKSFDEYNWSIGTSFFVQKHLYALDVPDFDYKGSRCDAIIDHYKYFAYKLCIRKYWTSPNDRNLFLQVNGVYSNLFKVNDNTWQNVQSNVSTDYTDNGTGYTETSYAALIDNFLLETEFGIKFTDKLMTASISATIPFKQYMYKSDFTYYSNGVAVGTTQTRKSQAGLWLNLTIPIEFGERTKKEKPPKVKPEPELPAVVELNDRKIKVQHTYTTSNKVLIIEVFDNASADGDTASVDFNGKWILEDYPVNKEPKQLTIELKNGENQIALYAKSLGITPPNTAAIAIIDGDKRKVFVLNSDYSSCGTLRIYKQE